MQKFVLEHEKYHIKDWQRLERKGNENYNWIWGEIKATFFGGLKHPLGFLFTALISLRPSRIKLYIERLKKGE
jgi:hypothetical protein